MGFQGGGEESVAQRDLICCDTAGKSAPLLAVMELMEDRRQRTVSERATVNRA